MNRERQNLKIEINRNAGLASGRKRKERTKERDKLIYLAYQYLVGARQTNAESRAAIIFLGDFDPVRHDLFAIPCNEPLSILSKVTKLTRSRILQIVKAKKPLNYNVSSFATR